MEEGLHGVAIRSEVFVCRGGSCKMWSMESGYKCWRRCAE